MKAQREQHMTECRYNLRDIPHGLENGILRLEMPVLILRSRLINEEVTQDLEAAGLTLREIENVAEDLMESFQALLLAKMLQKRRV